MTYDRDQGHWFLECRKNDEIQLSNDSDAIAIVEWLEALYLLGLRIHASVTYLLTYLLTYLRSWLGAYKTDNIPETVEDRAKFTINGLHKVVHWLSIAAKMYDLVWSLRQIQGRRFFKCRENSEIQLSNDSDAIVEWLDALYLLGLCIQVLVTYLLS